MSIMLIAVTIVSFLIGQASTGILVAALVLLNVVLGARHGRIIRSDRPNMLFQNTSLIWGSASTGWEQLPSRFRTIQR